MKWAFGRGPTLVLKWGPHHHHGFLHHWTVCPGMILSCTLLPAPFFWVYPPKTNMEPENDIMMVSNRNLLFQGFIFRFHVSFPGCNPCETSKPTSHPMNEKSRGFWDEKYTNSKRNFLQSLANLQVGLGYMVLLLKDDVWNACQKAFTLRFEPTKWFQNYNLSKCWKTLGVSFSTLIEKKTGSYDYSIHVYKLNFPTKHMIKPIPRPEASRHRVGRWSLVSRCFPTNRCERVLVSKVYGAIPPFFNPIYYGERSRDPSYWLWLCCFCSKGSKAPTRV